MAPTVVEYRPEAQWLHAVIADTVAYFPATHSLHMVLLTPDEPALQMQSVCLPLATGASEFSGHAWHTFVVALTSSEYWPCRQLLHV